MIPSFPIHSVVHHEENKEEPKPTLYPQQSEQKQSLPSQPTQNRESAIQEFQQRLVLLNHASKCEGGKFGRCRITPYCQSMRALWLHVNHCNEQNCSYTSCISTRFLLAHYYKCLDDMCMICKPLKDSITRSYNRTRCIVRMPLRRTFDRYEVDESPLGSPREGFMARERETDLSEQPCAKQFRRDSSDSLSTALNSVTDSELSVRSPILVCGKCCKGITQGYRYHCVSCQLNFCSACYHCEDGGEPHEHPVRAFQIDAPST